MKFSKNFNTPEVVCLRLLQIVWMLSSNYVMMVGGNHSRKEIHNKKGWYICVTLVTASKVSITKIICIIYTNINFKHLINIEW